jgi:Zn-dependent peptidase ImmA (M78 family)/predicted secreted protein
MPTLTAHQRATRAGIRAAQQEHQRLGTDLHGRVAIFDTIERERIWLMFRRLHNLYGVYKRQGDAAGIIINSQHPLTLQRFTAAHEYGHHVLGHLGSADDEARITRRSQDLQEAAAQAFAGEFLMPLQLVNYVLRTMGLKGKNLPLTARQVYEVALELGVSYGAAVTQLVGQHILTVTAGRRLREQSPLALKTMLGGVKPVNPWADVWLLDETQEGRELMPRLEDEIHVMLEENPSTGFVWTLVDAPSTALALVDDAFEEAEDDDDLVGSNGRRHLRFRVASAGEALLRLEKKRPWQHDGKAVATFEATVHASPPLTGDAEEGLAEEQKRSVLAGGHAA